MNGARREARKTSRQPRKIRSPVPGATLVRVFAGTASAKNLRSIVGRRSTRSRFFCDAARPRSRCLRLRRRDVQQCEAAYARSAVSRRGKSETVKREIQRAEETEEERKAGRGSCVDPRVIDRDPRARARALVRGKAACARASARAYTRPPARSALYSRSFARSIDRPIDR